MSYPARAEGLVNRTNDRSLDIMRAVVQRTKYPCNVGKMFMITQSTPIKNRCMQSVEETIWESWYCDARKKSKKNTSSKTSNRHIFSGSTQHSTGSYAKTAKEVISIQSRIWIPGLLFYSLQLEIKRQNTFQPKNAKKKKKKKNLSRNLLD